jgi:hypothetical protein
VKKSRLRQLTASDAPCHTDNMNNGAFEVPAHWLADDGLYDPDAATLLSEAEWDLENARHEKEEDCPMKYELWAMRDGFMPELAGQFDFISRAALSLASFEACHDPEVWVFWLQCPERITQDNPEGIELSDLVVLQAAHDLAQSRRRRRVHLANAGSRLGIACKGRDLSELLALSIGVNQGKYFMPKRLPKPNVLELVHRSLDWAVRFPNIVNAAR